MKKFFFPFAKKYSHLSEFAWHRFAVVIFWILIPVSLGGIFLSNQTPEIHNYNGCVQVWVVESSGVSAQSIDATCSFLSPDTGFNFLFAIIGTLIASYLMQILYYKVLLYIALRKK
jgi:hypothetical protein